MGQKTSPISFRQIIKSDWPLKWFSKSDYKKFLLEDLSILNYIREKLSHCFVSKVEIKREKNMIEVIIHTARPGLVIGRSGTGINVLKDELSKLVKSELKIDIEEVKEPDLDARLVALLIAQQIEKRVSYKRAMKQALTRIMEAGAAGAKITLKGRLAGVEIARSETVSAGKIPLGTITAPIDYAQTAAKTKYGLIGIKVWIYKGEKDVNAEKA